MDLKLLLLIARYVRGEGIVDGEVQTSQITRGVIEKLWKQVAKS